MTIYGIQITGTHGTEVSRSVATRLLDEAVKYGTELPIILFNAKVSEKARWAKEKGYTTLSIQSINHQYQAQLS